MQYSLLLILSIEGKCLVYIVYVHMRGCVCYQNNITKCCHTIIIMAFHKQMNQLYGVVLMKHMVLLVTNKIMVVYYQLNY